MKRILIIRLSAIGDVVMASGLLPALRRRWPEAHIAWLVEPVAAELLRGHPLLDEVIVWPRGDWHRLLRERRYGQWLGVVRRFVAELRRRRFDLALDTQGLLKSALWAWMSGAAERVGLDSREGSGRLMTRRVSSRRDDPRMSSEYRELAAALGLPAEAFQLSLAVAPAAAEAAGTALRSAGVEGRYAVLCPFTTRPQKHWFEDRWTALAVRLAEQGLTPVLLGGPADRDAAARIAEAGPAIVNLTGRLPLAASVAAIRQAALLIGVDTGLTHMGTAFGIPTLALFGSTRPYLEPLSPRTRVLYQALDCSPCRRHPSCGGRYDCMRAHSVDGVLAAALTLLEDDR